MSTYQRILVAVDGSEASAAALREALRFARDQGALLRIVHVVDALNTNLDGEFLTFDAIQDALRKSGGEILKKADASAHEAGVTAETRLLEIDRFGQRVAEMIAEEGRHWPADLMVVGSHGRRGLSRLFLGSVAAGVARVSSQPVLIIRSKENEPR